MKTSLALVATTLLALPAFAAPEQAQADLPIVAAPPGVMIDFYPVAASTVKGGRFINAPALPKLGYVATAPALQVERLRSVKKIHAKMEKTVIGADGKKRIEASTVPAVEMTLSTADATAFADLMKKSVGQRIYIEAQGTPIYAPLVRSALPAKTLTFNLADDKQLDAVYAKLAPFVKK